MGFFSRYSDSDKINHIALIIMAYESDAYLHIERYPIDVGRFWIEYKKEWENGSVSRSLESYETPAAQLRRLSALEHITNIEITGSGVLPYYDAIEILKPLFLKIRQLEEKIKLL
ncbi:MAG: hypothetical protein HOO92_04555 [Methylococcaceae bacterium]|nr:hypothetical protein [Methylococcaceae bacterium]